MRVAIEGPNEDIFGKSERMLDFSYFASPSVSRFYDLSRDDRLLLLGRSATVFSDNITVVINWTEELKRRVPLN